MIRGLPRTIVRRYALQNHMNGHDDDPRKETQAVGGDGEGNFGYDNSKLAGGRLAEITNLNISLYYSK